MGFINKKSFPGYFALFVLGFTSLATQTIFLRELAIIFYGNELIYGLILAVWLLTYALGAAGLGAFADKIKNTKIIYSTLQLFFALLLPLSVFLVRAIKYLMNIPLGLLPNLPTVVLLSLLFLFPLTVILGGLFSLGCRLVTEEAANRSAEIGFAYMFEASGSFLSGALLSFFLLQHLNVFQLIPLLFFLIIFSSFYLTKNSRLLMLIVPALFLLLFSNNLEHYSNQLTWHGFSLIESVDSPYGRIAVTQSHDDYNFFVDGSLAFSTADRPGIEEFIHLSFLPGKPPANVLLIGGVFGGPLEEILKYPVKRVDLVELDPALIGLAKKYLKNKIPDKVHLHAIDGVSFVNQTDNKYDLIILNLPNPETALINRFYTRDFFLKGQALLSPKGKLVFKLPISTAYMGQEMRLLNSSIYKTALSVFPHVYFIPGLSNYYFASIVPLEMDRAFLVRQWQAKKIPTSYFKLSSLQDDLRSENINFVAQSIRPDGKTRLNSDLNPVSYYHSLLLWASYSPSSFKYFLEGFSSSCFFYILMALGLSSLLARLFYSAFKRSSVYLLSAILGFSGMTSQIMIILFFQAKLGYLYQTIGFLNAAFMGGLALGCYLSSRFGRNLPSPSRAMKFILAGFLFTMAAGALVVFVAKALLLFIFLSFLSLLVGFFVGAAFPLLVMMGHPTPTGRLSGFLYGADLFGSSLAALLASLLFIPIFGLPDTLLLTLWVLALSFLFIL